MIPDPLERGSPVGNTDHIEALASQTVRENLAGHLVVIDDEQRGLSRQHEGFSRDPCLAGPDDDRAGPGAYCFLRQILTGMLAIHLDDIRSVSSRIPLARDRFNVTELTPQLGHPACVRWSGGHRGHTTDTSCWCLGVALSSVGRPSLALKPVGRPSLALSSVGRPSLAVISTKPGIAAAGPGTLSCQAATNLGSGRIPPMARARSDTDLAGQLSTLYSLGTVGSLPDDQLVERFCRRERPGRLGSGVCRAGRAARGDGPVRLPAAPARTRTTPTTPFRRTFLVLVSKADSIRRRESVGGWLFGIARRVAARARVEAARRRRQLRNAVR